MNAISKRNQQSYSIARVHQHFISKKDRICAFNGTASCFCYSQPTTKTRTHIQQTTVHGLAGSGGAHCPQCVYHFVLPSKALRGHGPRFAPLGNSSTHSSISHLPNHIFHFKSPRRAIVRPPAHKVIGEGSAWRLPSPLHFGGFCVRPHGHSCTHAPPTPTPASRTHRVGMDTSATCASGVGVQGVWGFGAEALLEHSRR